MVRLGKKLIVVSNRAPYSAKKGGYEKAAGGLVTALDPVMRSAKGVWITSGGSRSRPRGTPAGEKGPPYTLKTVSLTPDDIEGFYNGYSNRCLWPLCHIALDRVLISNRYWESYRKVNRLFAQAVLDEIDGGDATVWLQDYHLALCASEIKEKSPLTPVSLFWHIPWPPYEVFRVCAHRRQILEGLLSNDLLGFQIGSFRDNFMGCVEKVLGSRVDYEKGMVTHKGKATVLKAFPISVDFEWFEKAARSGRGKSLMKVFLKKRNLETVRLALGVSRLDYAKGMLKGLDIISRFFSEYPGYRGKVTFVQVAIPTRKAEPYLSYRELVKKRAASINRTYAKNGWRPVELVFEALNHLELAALYRRSDIALISSINDGMNLVAKEYLASQVDLTGSLLVSEFTGAAEEIPGVTAINPYDTEASAAMIKAALESSPSKRRRSIERARRHIKTNDIYRWVDGILRELKRIG